MRWGRIGRWQFGHSFRRGASSLCWARRLSRRDFEVFRLGTAIAERHYSYDCPELPGSTYARFLIENSVSLPLGSGGPHAHARRHARRLEHHKELRRRRRPRRRVRRRSASSAERRCRAERQRQDDAASRARGPRTAGFRASRAATSLADSRLPAAGGRRSTRGRARLEASQGGGANGTGRGRQTPIRGALGRSARPSQPRRATRLGADVILLDEPTNNLDFDGLELLERFVEETPSALVVVSHDRAFLEQSVERIVEFEAETRKVREFAGSWDEYERLRGLARKREEEAYARYVTERDRFTGLLHERRGQARSAGKMANRRGTQALRSKVRAADRRLERLEKVDKPWQPWRLQLELPSSRAGDVVVRLSGAVVERGDFRLGPVDLELRHGDRLAVVGPNGSGKTTLLGALLGDLPLTRGDRRAWPGVRLGELEQRRSELAGPETLLETFCDRSGLPAGEARTLLAKFALGADDVLRPSV